MTKLANPLAFFARIRNSGILGVSLTTAQVQGVNAIVSACGAAHWRTGFTAYALGTARRETGTLMRPVHEQGGPEYFRVHYDITGNAAKARELGNTRPGDGAKYHGRGYPQMTGRANYAKAQRELGVPFLDNPDLALLPANAAAIMVLGMSEGWFTGKKLADYLPGSHGTLAHFTEARRIINGTDHADEIARFALTFQSALDAGHWS